MKKFFIVILFSILFAQSEDTTKSTQNVSLVATSNVFAEYYDCGCPKAPLGGLARKAFFFKNMMSDRKPLLVDAGNTFFSHGVINPDGLRVNQKKYKAKNLVGALSNKLVAQKSNRRLMHKRSVTLTCLKIQRVVSLTPQS